MANWTTDNIPDQTGRIIIITGANSGLGYETTLALAQKNATVVMACRNQTKGAEARDQVLANASGAQVDLMALDLGDLSSVRTFAEQFREKYSRLDVLINNAGVMAIPRTETVDGFEMQLGVNHLGHFALTGLLIDLLIATPKSRVVSVSSFGHVTGKINFDDLMLKENYTRYGAYGQSKLANILFANELQKRLSAIGAKTISLSAHPGLSATNLQSTSTHHSGALAERIIYPIIMNTVAQSAAMGALPPLYAGFSDDANGCDYIGPRWMHTRGYPKKVRADKSAYDENTAKRLWEVSEELTGVQYTALAH